MPMAQLVISGWRRSLGPSTLSYSVFLSAMKAVFCATGFQDLMSTLSSNSLLWSVITILGKIKQTVAAQPYCSFLHFWSVSQSVSDKWIQRPFCKCDFIRVYYFHLQDVARELSTELTGKPDLIIGNYTDGNLVASLLSHRLGVTQVFFFLFLLGFMLSIAVTISCYLLSWWWWYIYPLKHPHMQFQELMVMPQFWWLNEKHLGCLCCSSVILHMHWRRQSIQIRISIGKSLRRSTIFHASSQQISLPWTMLISSSPAHIKKLLAGIWQPQET